MATLQEQATRAWAPRRGVTVYSPTRPLVRPQGGTANAGTAARILQGRQPSWFNQPQGTGQFAPGQMTPLPAYTPPEQPGMGRTALDDILDRMSAAGPPPEQEQGPGGWRGVLGTVANSVPGKAIFAALDVLDRPRRAVASTINEGLDALGLNAESRSDGDASWSDWWNQFNDPTFGFGDIVASTGNKWLDRGIGLAGDIAMDPLTYLVGTGVVAGTGARARVGLAARAYGAGVAPEVAARTGRIGIQALSNVERRAINAATDGAEQLLDRGYRFKLPFIDAANAPRIPGTGRIEQAIGGTVARARNAISSTRPLSTMRYWRSERGLQDAIGKILTGRGDISFGVAAALVNYRKGAGIAGNRVAGLLAAEWNRLVAEHSHAGLQAMVHEAETVGGTVLNRFYNLAADLMEKEGLQRPNFPNYIPHVFTDEGFAWIRNTPEGKSFHNQLFKEIDFDDLTPHMMQRKLVGAGPDGNPRVYVINGVRMEFKEGSIREINEQFAKAVPEAGFKLLDDDISNITARYSKSMSNSVAEAGGLLYLANQARGLVRYADDDSVLKEIVNAAETRKLNVDAHQTIKQKLSAANELVASMKKQRDEGITALHGPMEAHLRKLVDTMDSLEPAAREELKGLLATQAMLSAQRDSLVKEPLEYTENAARLEAATNAAFEQIDQQYQAATKRLADIEPAFQLAEQQWLDAQRVAVAARQAGTAGVKSPPMSEVQRAYRKGVVELTQLSIDRDAAASINQRVQAALRKEQIIERNLDSDTFAAMAGERMGLGEVDVMPPTKYIDPDTGEVQWIDPGTPVNEIPEGVVLRRETPEGVQQARMQEALDPRRSRRRTPEMIYREHNARRARAIRNHEQNFPVLREYQNRIEAQTQVVLAAREDLFNAASVHARKVQDAKLQVHEWRKIENELTGKIEDLEGNPRWAGQQKQYLRQLEELKAPGGPRDRALRAYTDAQRPMTDAKTKYDQAVAKLEELKQAQNAEARKIRLEPRDILSEQVRGAGLRHIHAGREVVASRGRLTRAQEALAGLKAQRAQLDPKTRAAQIGAIDQQIRQAQEAVTAREAELANQIATVDAIKGELDTLRTQRQRMDTTDYFAEQLTDINLRNRDVNAALRAQVQGRERYAQTANGRAEVVLRNERAKLNHAIDAGDRQFEYWRGTQVGAPWRPVEVVKRADGTYEVQPRWGNTLGVSESQAMLEMAEKRAWYTEHYIDGLSNELDVIASDIMRARDRLAEMTDNRGGRITKLQKQIDRMTTRHRRLTTRLERRRRFAVDEYDAKLIKLGAGPRQIAEGGSYSVEGLKRRAALIEQVNEMVAARNALVIERERINSRLLATGNQLDEYDKNIKLLRDERFNLHKELADTVKEQTIGVVPVRAETLYGRYLQPVGQSERNALQTAQGMAYGYKVAWEPVDIAPTDLQRYGVWTPEERTNLNIAYAIQDAWERTPNEFRTAEFKAQRDAAVRYIRELTNPNVTRGGASHAQHHLQMIIENVDEEGLSAALDELQRSRIPFRKPAQRSDLGKALEKGSGAGSRTPDSIARRAVKMFKELNVDYGEKFVQSGAISPGTMQYYNHKWIELQDVMQAYAATVGRAGGASPILLSRRDQLANDLNRFNEIMFTYRAALEEGGAEPSHSLAAFIAAERLDKESATVLTELQRTLRALGNPVVAAEDAVLDARRLRLTNKVDKALYDYEELAGTYNEVSLGRALTDDEARMLRNSRAKYNRLRKELEDVPDTPMASVLTDEVEHIAYLVGQYIEGISASFSDMKNARSIVHHQGSPIRQARLKEATIEKATADINRGDEEIATVRRLIQEAQQKGENTITYVPWHRVQRFGMTPQELLDEIATGTRTKISQQQESRLGPKARKAIAEGNEDLIYWERTFTGNEEPVTVDLYTAINKVHSDEASMLTRKWNLEKEIALREAYLGRATDWINHYRRIIEDQLRPPNVDVLRGQLRDLEYEAGRISSFEDLRVNPFDEVELAAATDGQRLQIQMLQDRIDLASGPRMTEGELETWQRKLAMYEETDANVRRQMGDDAAYVEAMAQAHPQDKPRGWYAMQSVRDDGRALFTDIVSGARQATDEDVKILTDLFGDAEEAELSVLWLNTFNQLIDVVKHRRLTEAQVSGPQSYLMAQRHPELAAEATSEYISEISRIEATYILSQLRELAGDSQLNDRFSNMIAESVQTGGFEQTAEELEATARRYDIRATEEAIEEGTEQAVEGVPQARGFNLQSIRNQIVSSLIESSVAAKNAAIQDAQRVMRLLGFDNYIQSTRKIQGTTMTGAQATARNVPVLTETRLSLLGYSVSKQTYSDPNKLREFITDMLHGTDFDYSHALRRNARKLSARLSRIDNMRRALGVSIDESANHVRDPDRFLGLLAKWREPAVDVPESGAEVLDRITDFNTNVLPPEMDQIYADRISRLNQDFAEAVIRNDIDEINRIGPMIRELHEANRPNPTANLGPEMPALHVAGMTPASTEQAAAQVAAEAVSTPPMNEKALAAQSVLEAAQRDVDNARNALATAEAQMGGGGPVAVPGDNAPTQARTLNEFMLDDEFEMGGSKLTRAEVLRRSDELIARRKQLPRRSADRDEAQQLEYRTITADLANLSARAWKEEPDWQVEAAEAIYEFEKNGTPPKWMLPTGEAANQETITRLRAELTQAEANLAEARSTADQFHLGPGDNTAGELADVAPPSDQSARRAELQAQAEAARAAGDENAARWAEQQMGWLDEPEAAAQPARVDPVEQTGVAAEVVPPDEMPLPPEVRLPDETPVPARQPLDQQFDEVVEEFRSLMQKYGPYENMPDEVKQRLAALSATARRLVDDRRNVRAADHSARQRLLDEVPELAAYLERVKRIPEAIPPTVASDWEQVIRNGPSVRTFDPMVEQKLKPKVKLYTGVAANEPAVRMLGEVFPSTGQNRRGMIAGNVILDAEGNPVLLKGAQLEASLRAQLEGSPRRVVQTARERLISRLNEIKAERIALQREGVQQTVDVMQANVAAIKAANAPMLGPELPELSPDELAAVARGEYERVAPEWREAFEAERSTARNLEAAKVARTADAQQEAERLAREERTRQLASIDMDLAKVRTDLEAVTEGVADYGKLRNQINSALDSVSKEMEPNSPMAQDMRDLAAYFATSPNIPPEEAKVLATLLEDALLAQRHLDRAVKVTSSIEARLKSFGDNPKKATIAGKVMKTVALDGWEGIATKLLRGKDATLSEAGEAAGLRANQSVLIAKELRDRLERVTRMMETPEAWKLVDKYTAFFKTYATGRPGFHVRNALSAIFMNMVDGVRIRDMYAGLSAWRKFTKNPRQFWDNATPQMRDAITAVLASGAGGQFAERGIATAGTNASKWYRMLMNNKYTRFNQRAGTLVEGAARMGMALNSTRRGQSLAGMIDRITKYHFNYRELSSMDVTARRYIPFWTFMSRNLPLQLEQMWLRPQMYLRYQSFVRNFAEQPDPMTPNYWLMQGAFTMDEDAENSQSPWYLAPDLPHLRVAEPFEAMTSGDWGKALLSDVNPLMMAPTEAFAFNKKVYTGAPIEGDYIEPSAAMTPLLPVLSLLGGTEKAASGQTVVDDRYAHVARSLLPPLELLERLTTEEGTRAGRQGETWARFFGAPVLKLTPELRESTARSQRAERREQRQTQAQLARL